MNAGRPALPLEQALARGTDGAEKRADNAPPRVEGFPNPPGWFDSYALECWVRLCSLLYARGQLSLDSGPSLEAACQCYSDWVRCALALRDSGFTQKVSGMYDVAIKAHPNAGVFSDLDRRWRGWLNEFGLTDASRGKVSGGANDAPSAADPLAKYGLH